MYGGPGGGQAWTGPGLGLGLGLGLGQARSGNPSPPSVMCPVPTEPNVDGPAVGRLFSKPVLYHPSPQHFSTASHHYSRCFHSRAAGQQTGDSSQKTTTQAQPGRPGDVRARRAKAQHSTAQHRTRHRRQGSQNSAPTQTPPPTKRHYLVDRAHGPRIVLASGRLPATSTY